ncbi:hypothetical protein DZB86_27165 [Bacillus sp. RC]|nr:hypothetical protein DZB86_27165 [Bacillus sp. RC]
MKYVDVVTESRVKTITLVLLLIFMSIGWYLNSSFWYKLVISIVSIAFILHGINYYITSRNKVKASMVIIAILGFSFYNLLKIFL